MRLLYLSYLLNVVMIGRVFKHGLLKQYITVTNILYLWYVINKMTAHFLHLKYDIVLTF